MSYSYQSKNATTYSNDNEGFSTILTFLATEDGDIMTSEAEDWLEIENTEAPTDYHYDGASAATYSDLAKTTASYTEPAKNSASYSNLSK